MALISILVPFLASSICLIFSLYLKRNCRIIEAVWQWKAMKRMELRGVLWLQVQTKALALKLCGSLHLKVNYAGVSSVEIDDEGLRALNIDTSSWLSGQAAKMVQGLIRQAYKKSEECLNTNYHGVKRVTEALLPLLQLSTLGARIVNITSIRGELSRIPSKSIRNELGDVETLSEDKLDALIRKFLYDLKENKIGANGWPEMLPACSISKAVLNAYARLLAKKHPDMCVNCVHPGFVKTDLNMPAGTMTVQEGAKGPLKCALLPYRGRTGCYFDQTQLAEF